MCGGFGDVSQGRKIRDGVLKVEVYGSSRFITVTGRPLVMRRLRSWICPSW
jgi:hypothetical protein